MTCFNALRERRVRFKGDDASMTVGVIIIFLVCLGAEGERMPSLVSWLRALRTVVLLRPRVSLIFRSEGRLSTQDPASIIFLIIWTPWESTLDLSTLID